MRSKTPSGPFQAPDGSALDLSSLWSRRLPVPANGTCHQELPSSAVCVNVSLYHKNLGVLHRCMSTRPGLMIQGSIHSMDTPWHRCGWQPLGHLRRQETAAAAPMACGSPIALAILGLVSTALERSLCRADHWDGIGTTGKRCQRASVRKEMSPTECAK